MPARPRTIYRVIDTPTSMRYCVVQSDGSIVEEPSLKRARIHLPNISGNNPIIPISRADWLALTNPTQWYLVCCNCGEAFDSIGPSIGHAGDDGEGNECWEWNAAHGDWDVRPMYKVATQDEAF